MTTGIYKNYNDILDVIKKIMKIKKKEVSGDMKVEAIGLSTILQSRNFCFCVVMMKTIFSILDAAEKMFESRKFGLRDSNMLIQVSIKSIENLRNEECLTDIIKEANAMIVEKEKEKETEKEKEKEKEEEKCKPAKRQRKMCSKLKDYVITGAIGERSQEVDLDEGISERQIYFSVLDRVKNEMNLRFTNNSVRSDRDCRDS